MSSLLPPLSALHTSTQKKWSAQRRCSLVAATICQNVRVKSIHRAHRAFRTAHCARGRAAKEERCDFLYRFSRSGGHLSSARRDRRQVRLYDCYPEMVCSAHLVLNPIFLTILAPLPSLPHQTKQMLPVLFGVLCGSAARDHELSAEKLRSAIALLAKLDPSSNIDVERIVADIAAMRKQKNMGRGRVAALPPDT